MLRSILLALDDTPASLAAKRLALALAAQAHASVTGVVVVDPEIVAPPEATPLGANAYKEHKDATLLQRAKGAASELARTFAYDAHEANVPSDSSVVTGDILASLTSASDVHDMIVAGVDTTFSDGASGKVSAVVERLLHKNPRPVIVCSREPQPGTRTLVAYDGSVPAMRAIQMFCCLGIRRDRDTLVVTIQDTEAGAAALSARGVEFMRDHGFSVSALPLTSKENPAAVLIEAAKTHNAEMIVAGAYGHRGWREWLLGSTTTHLLEESPFPVFIHH